MEAGRERSAHILWGILLALMPAAVARADSNHKNDVYDAVVIRSWVELPPGLVEGNTFLEKSVYRMGDRIAVGIVYGFSKDELLEPTRVKRVLDSVRLSFSQPQFITREIDRKPRATALLLYFLEGHVEDPSLVESIRATESEVERIERKPD